MSKAKNTEKKSRSRNLKGLSVFDDEIAAPADYGDFMKIDAPVALRVAQETQAAPEWEKFIGIDSPVKPNTVETKSVLTASSLSEDDSVDVANEQEIESVEVRQVNEELKEEVLSKPPLPAVDESSQNIELNRHKTDTLSQPVSVQEIEIKVESRPKQRSIEVRSVAKHKPQELHDFEMGGFGGLVGLQRKLILFMFSDCYPRASLKTRTLTREHLSASLSVPFDSINTSVIRLIQKSFISRVAFKRGRGGWAVYELSKEIYQELTRLQQNIGFESLNPREVVQTDTKQTQVEAEAELSDEYKSIDYSGLGSIGFGRSHIYKLSQKDEKVRLTAEEIQNSINFFAFDLKFNNKLADIKSKNPLAYIMGILLGGAPYSPPVNYRSPEDIARSEYLSSLKAIEENRRLEEEQLKKLLMTDWFKSLSAEEKAQIKASAPSNAKEAGPAQQIFIEDYFDQKIWPNLKSQSYSKLDKQQISEDFRTSLNSGNA